MKKLLALMLIVGLLALVFVGATSFVNASAACTGSCAEPVPAPNCTVSGECFEAIPEPADIGSWEPNPIGPWGGDTTTDKKPNKGKKKGHHHKKWKTCKRP